MWITPRKAVQSGKVEPNFRWNWLLPWRFVICGICENHPTTFRNSVSKFMFVNHLNEDSEIPNRCKLHFCCWQSFVFLPFLEVSSLIISHTSCANLFYFKQDSGVELETFLRITYFPSDKWNIYDNEIIVLWDVMPCGLVSNCLFYRWNCLTDYMASVSRIF